MKILLVESNEGVLKEYGEEWMKIKVDGFNDMMGCKGVDCWER